MEWRPVLTTNKKNNNWTPVINNRPSGISLSPIDLSTGASTPQTTEKGTVDFLKAFGQGIAQGFGASGAAIENIPREVTAVIKPTPENLSRAEKGRFFVPNGRLQEAIFGTNRSEGFSLATEAEDITFGFVKEASPLAIPLGGLIGTLDLFTGGTGSKTLKSLSQFIRRTKDVDEISSKLTKAGFSVDLVEEVAPRFAKLTDETKIQKELVKLQNTHNEVLKVAKATEDPDAVFSIKKGDSTKEFRRLKNDVETQLKTSQPSKRVASEDGAVRQFTRFPEFVPKELRISELVNRVLSKRENNLPITGSRERALNDVIDGEILKRMEPKLADEFVLNKISEEADITLKQNTIETTSPQNTQRALDADDSRPAPSTPQEQTPKVSGQQPTNLESFSSPPLYPKKISNATLSSSGENALKRSLDKKEASSLVNKMKKVATSVVEYIQNSDERVRQLVRRPDVRVTKETDPYLNATLYFGRVQFLTDEGLKFAERNINEIVKLSKSLGEDIEVTRGNLNDYLVARHAPERNKALGDGAAGITTEQAEQLVKDLETPELKKIADDLIEFNKKTLDILNEGGVISDDLLKTLRDRYKQHVPLNRIFEESDDIGSILTGKGFDVRTTGIQAAKGSDREVSDIVTNIITNYEQAVLRSEKNIVDQATLAFARDNKDTLGDLLKVRRPKQIGEDFAGNPILETTNDPNILQLFENGKRIWIEITDPSLAVALRGVGREKLGPFLRVVASFTRLYSGLATRFNPEFALPNKLRDLQETMVFMAAQDDVGFKGALKTSVRDPNSTKDVVDALRGKETAGAKLYNELRQMGGTTGGLGLSTRKRVEMDVENMFKTAKSNPRRFGRKFIQTVDDWNTVFEDSTRLSVYKQARAQGLSKERSAFLAKEASINFNRMGRGGPVINSIWMFSNASIQGTGKMIRSLKNPKVAAAVGVTIAAAVGTTAEWNDAIDPEWRDKITKWDRLNGLPIILSSDGDGIRYVTIPVSWGIKPIKVMADHAYDVASGHEFDPAQVAEDTFTSVMDAYNPVGGTDPVSSITPTIIDVPQEIARNRAWSGAKIKPDFDPNAPPDIQYFDSLKDKKTGEIAVGAGKTLSSLGILVSPADIHYAFEQYVGGAGRSLGKTANTLWGGFTGDFPPVDEFPFFSRFVRIRAEEEFGRGSGKEGETVKDLLQQQSRDRFLINEQAEDLVDEWSSLPPEEANERWTELLEINPQLAEKIIDIKKDRDLGLTSTERWIKNLGVSNGVRAKYIKGRLDELKTREEKNALWNDFVSKKIISETVAGQIRELINK